MESQDWAEMLLRMYLRWAERKGFRATVLDLTPGEGAGLKSATLRVEGENAFGFLSTESGVHRLIAFLRSIRPRAATLRSPRSSSFLN